MGNLAFLLARYWKKHKRSAFSLLFSGTLLVLVVVFLFLQIRTDFDRKEGLHDTQPQPLQRLTVQALFL